MNQDPNQTPAPAPVSAPTPATHSPSQIDTRNTTRRRILLITSGIVLLALISFGVYVAMHANAKKNDQALIDNSSQNESQKTDTTDRSDVITTSLPNGKVATYANTEANQNLSFSSSDKGADYVNVSFKAIEEYLSAADKNTVAKLCGANGELAQIDGIVVATISTNVRVITYPTENNCLDEFATMRNTDSTSRTSASALIKQVSDDVKQFYAKVIIK
jgi:hypothetical protein